MVGVLADAINVSRNNFYLIILIECILIEIPLCIFSENYFCIWILEIN